ncbi:hypothetical protein J2Y48_000141 [Mycoplana sp. BE70]|uniref:hypothetical protein n=1 Tax=Mycoplana sp. BE70 TaxID=2817775 RepID=UPI002858040E|nr:hypothetical protein [Mycoplana sp. BE70]MDR6754868.1 hypothetical protein [Mycoplana sp. BE70]
MAAQENSGFAGRHLLQFFALQRHLAHTNGHLGGAQGLQGNGMQDGEDVHGHGVSLVTAASRLSANRRIHAFGWVVSSS